MRPHLACLTARPSLAFSSHSVSPSRNPGFIWGAQGKPVTVPAILAQPLSNELFFITECCPLTAVVVVMCRCSSWCCATRGSASEFPRGTLDETVAALGINGAQTVFCSLNFAGGVFLAGLSGAGSAAGRSSDSSQWTIWGCCDGLHRLNPPWWRQLARHVDRRIPHRHGIGNHGPCSCPPRAA